MRAEQKLMDFSNKMDQFKPIVVPSHTTHQSIASDRDYEAESLKNKLFGLTYNNFGCTYKQRQEFQASLDALKRSLYYESREEKLKSINGRTQLSALAQSNSAGTILNICAILSKLG